MKKRIKNIPIIGEFLKKFLRRIKRVIKGKKITYEYQKIIINRYLKNIDTQIVQIGSNDGKAADPLYKLVLKNDKWSVLYVEPVPYLFERLKNNFPKDPRISFENVAINDGSKQTFYYVSENVKDKIADLPRWVDQIGSFDRSHITKHLDGILELHIKEIDIKGITLDQLFINNNIKNLGLLHIDTEGHDWKILSQLDLNKYKPSIILFEHCHLNKEEIKEAIDFLESSYWILNQERDFLCILKKLVSEKDFKGFKKNVLNII